MMVQYVEPRADLYGGWRALYGAYGASVGDEIDDRVARTVWDWFLTGRHGVRALLAVSENAVLGFVHYRPFPRTLHGNEACFLDDLYVAPEQRGRGIAGAMVQQVCDVARSCGWSEVRWVTTPENAPARALYERIATLSDLITYRISL